MLWGPLLKYWSYTQADGGSRCYSLLSLFVAEIWGVGHPDLMWLACGNVKPPFLLV